MSILLEIKGRTMKGKSLGKSIGFPTLNIAYRGEISGVFVGKVFINDEAHFAAINLGSRPTVDNEKHLCEAHLLDWSGNVSEGTEIRVELLEKIREVQKFENFEKLKEQIFKDVEYAKKFVNDII